MIANAYREGMVVFVVPSGQAWADRVVPNLEGKNEPAALARLQRQIGLRRIAVCVETAHIQDRQNSIECRRAARGVWANIAARVADPARAHERTRPRWSARTRERNGVSGIRSTILLDPEAIPPEVIAGRGRIAGEDQLIVGHSQEIRLPRH